MAHHQSSEKSKKGPNRILLNRIAGQLSISAGLRIFSTLEKEISFKCKNTLGKGIEKPDDFDMELLSILNWIALFFAQTSQDSAAVAISKDAETDVLNVYVSINRDAIGNSQHAQANSFQTCVYEVLSSSSKTADADSPSTQEVKGGQYGVLINTIVQTCWAMIHHRLEHLRAAIAHGGGPDTLLMLWQSLKKS